MSDAIEQILLRIPHTQFCFSPKLVFGAFPHHCLLKNRSTIDWPTSLPAGLPDLDARVTRRQPSGPLWQLASRKIPLHQQSHVDRRPTRAAARDHDDPLFLDALEVQVDAAVAHLQVQQAQMVDVRR